MLLVVDAGNTNVVVAVHDGTEWRGIWRIATEPQRTSDEYAVWLLTLLSLAGLKREQVVGRGDRHGGARRALPPAPAVPRLVRGRAAGRPRHARLGVRDQGRQSRGSRRRPAAERAGGASHLSAARWWSIDFGTATTFDVVDSDGGYLGGIIAPGINLSIEALHRAAARLPRIGIGRPQAVIGRDTVPAMQSGIYWGYVAHDRGAGGPHPGRISAAPLKVIATGGLAPLLAEGTTVIESYRSRSDAGRPAHVGGAQPRPHITPRTGAAARHGLNREPDFDVLRHEGN